MAAEAAAAAAAEAAAVEAATAAATEAAATAAAEQAAAAAATEAATTAGTQAATQAATGIETLAPVAESLPPPGTGIEMLVQAPPAPAATSNPLYQLQAPGYQGVNAPVDVSGGITRAPTQYDLTNQAANYNLAGSVPSPAATQTATAQPGMFDKALDWVKDNKLTTASMGLQALNYLNKKGPEEKEKYSGPLSKFKFNPDVYQPYVPQPPTPYQPKMYNYAGGGPVEMMSNANAIGANTGYPMADINKGAYATPWQTPISRNVVGGASDTGVNPMTGEMAFAGGGIANLGAYSDGGRMLKGPGDGMSDSIPATIANKQPARLANEEFVVPADVVSHLGNGSSDAGAKALYKMMDRVRQARTGKKAQGKKINPEKYLA
jgi:hypothetical protein